MTEALTFDDVYLVPGYSELESRNDVDLTTNFIMRNDHQVDLNIPFISSPMDTVTGPEMCFQMFKMGGFGFLHRDGNTEDLCEVTNDIFSEYYNGSILHSYGISIGVNETEKEIGKLIDSPYTPLIYLIDIAHGHCKKMKDRIQWLKKRAPKALKIVAGNVCTADGTEFLQDLGVDTIRVGIGCGSMCTTRVMTGCGVPQLSAIADCSRVANVPIIADGGIRNPGDAVKALAFGANMVMLGKVLAGTKPTPGRLKRTGDGLIKEYRGSASLSCKTANSKSERHIEGESTFVRYQGTIETIIYPFLDGLRSGMSYIGAKNISEMTSVKWNKVTLNGNIEALPHGVKGDIKL